MIVGILSDTHGRADAAAAAVRLLADAGAEHLIHCGDVGDDAASARAVLDAMAGHRATFVFGNNDVDRDGLARYAADLGVTCGRDLVTLDLDGRVAVVTHGDDEDAVDRVLAEQSADYLFVGHSHAALDRRDLRVRTINPGALYRATVKTVAVLDTAADTVRFVTVPVPGGRRTGR